LWQVIIENGADDQVLETLTQRFQLMHVPNECYLTTTGNKLPEWGFDQHEVSCNPKKNDKSSFWSVEFHYNPKLPEWDFQNLEMCFFQRFIEAHIVMLMGNSGLKPKAGDDQSRPWMWPINRQGQFFSVNRPQSIYLLGNPIIWWGNLVYLLIFLSFLLVRQIQVKRGVVLSANQLVLWPRTKSACSWLLFGWLLHYAPFWTMTRMLYFHHYFPALLFNSMLSGIVVVYLIESLVGVLPAKIADRTYYLLTMLIVSTLIYSFYLFAPLSYGYPMEPVTFPIPVELKTPMTYLRWIPTWEF